MRNKKIYGGILFVTLVIALFWESALIRTLFAYEVLMLPLLFLQAEYFARNLESRLHVPVRYVQKGQEFAVEVELENHSFMPMESILVEISCENEFTKSRFSAKDTAMAEARKKVRLQFFLEAKYCGRVKVSVEKVKAQDYLRLFSRGNEKKNQSEEVMVLPVIHKIPVQQSFQLEENLEGQLFSKNRTGEDTSEVFDIREYRSGDTSHRIHWKLSAKTDDFMVKEYSLPMERTVLLFLDLHIGKEEKFTQQKLDYFLEILASLSWSMQEQNWHHKVIWWDEQNQMLKEADVSSEEETFRMLEQICSSRGYSKAYEIQELYFRQFGERIEELGMLLDISGKLYRDGRCIKVFRQEKLEEDLMEWELEL